MSDARLSTRERATLLALMALAREVSNKELEDAVGFRLLGKERERLNEMKLVTSRKQGQLYVHQLTDAGGRWCEEEFIAGPSPIANSMERALYAILTGLDRYLRRSKLEVTDLFTMSSMTVAGGRVSIESRIHAAYRKLVARPGQFVKLTQLRELLSDLPREKVDQTLDLMYQGQHINLVPQSNQRGLSDADRDAAIVIGGQLKHRLSIEAR